MKPPKNAGKAPSMQWYPADWRKDTAVQMLSFHDRGVWFELINIMHESAERGVLVINGAPMPEDALSRLLGLDKQTFNQTLSNLLTYGVAKQRDEDGAIYCKRMVEDEKLSQLRREAGKMGGNPNLVNQNSNQKPTTRVKQNPTPSSSTSSSTSKGKQTPAEPSAKAKASTPEELEEFAISIGCPPGQGAAAFWRWQGNGWENAGKPIKDWKGTVRAWKALNYGPFKVEVAPAAKETPKSFAQKDREDKEAARHGAVTIQAKVLTLEG